MLQSDGKIQKEDTADWKNYTYSNFQILIMISQLQ